MKKGYKIAFIGTHGTGKTTIAHQLVYELKKRGVNADFSEEIARRCPLPINETASSDTQKWILGRQVTEETEKSYGCDVLVCDRSVLDTYSYQVSLQGRNISWEEFIKDHLKTYDLLIKVPVKKREIKRDGKRSTNQKFQLDVEENIETNLNLFKPDYIIYSGEETIENICNKYLKKIP
ncbi:MAG TPA: AAA family ATPase [Candidatus Nanoarchaeia archaeon]|nr:AAA family ATPase [Candidatus Nanoarchaeia archaeon]